MTTPTQSQHPWRATVRTIAAAVIAFALLAPAIAAELGVDSVPWVAGFLTAIGAVTRVMAIPGVVAWVRKYAPFLAPDAAHKEL